MTGTPHPVVAALTAVRWQATDEQWRLIAAGLWDGCTPLRLANAVGLELTPLRRGLTCWAADATTAGVLREHEYTSLMDLVFGPAD